MSKKTDEASVERMYDLISEVAKERFMTDPVLFDRNRLQVEGYVLGVPFNIHFRFIVQRTSAMISIFSILPYEAESDRISAVVARLNDINYCDLSYGSYSMDKDSGRIVFSCPLMFRGSLLSRELIEETLAFVAETVSGYNTELFGLSGGKLAE